MTGYNSSDARPTGSLLLTVSEATRALRISRSSIYRLFRGRRAGMGPNRRRPPGHLGGNPSLHRRPHRSRLVPRQPVFQHIRLYRNHRHATSAATKPVAAAAIAGAWDPTGSSGAGGGATAAGGWGPIFLTVSSSTLFGALRRLQSRLRTASRLLGRSRLLGSPAAHGADFWGRYQYAGR